MRFSLLLISLLFFQAVFSQDSQNVIKQDSIYKFKARLTDNSTLTPGCGVIAFAVAKIFEIIESDYPVNRNVTIIIQCPELNGNGFFVTDEFYSIEAGLKNDASFDWLIIPQDYAKEKLPVFWARIVKKSKK